MKMHLRNPFGLSRCNFSEGGFIRWVTTNDYSLFTNDWFAIASSSFYGEHHRTKSEGQVQPLSKITSFLAFFTNLREIKGTLNCLCAPYKEKNLRFFS